jgi:hypothetical protein
LGRLAAADETLLAELEQAFADPANETRLLGQTLKCMVVEAVARIGTPQAVALTRKLLEQAGDDRDDISWHLRASGLPSS